MLSTVDRGLARAIAYKRIVTGSLGLLGGVGLITATLAHGARATPLIAAGVIIFFGGGAWTLRDGLRLRRLLGPAPSGDRPSASVDRPHEGGHA